MNGYLKIGNWVILIFLLAVSVYADGHLQKGIRAYESGDFDKSIDELNKAIARKYQKSDLVTAYKYLALSHIGKAHMSAAEEAFKHLLKLDPKFNINPRDYSSKVYLLFQQVRTETVDTLTITSKPGGAIVFLDDERVGVTKLDTGTLKLDVLVGRHYVKFSKKYFEEKSQWVNISKKSKNEIRVNLTLIKLALHIVTEPTAAHLYVNDQLAGTTPIIIDSHIGEKLTIKLTKKGFRDKQAEIQMLEKGIAKVGDDELPLINEVAFIHFNLEPMPPGKLNISSVPPGATIYLDGVSAGVTPHSTVGLPLTLNDVAIGRHALRFQLDKFGDIVKTVEVVSGKTTQIQGKLGCVISIASVPTGAGVYLNGTHIGKTPLVTDRIPKRTYHIRLSKEGHIDEILKAALTDEIKLTAKLAPKTGSLVILSEPKNATVFLDGKQRGNTPITIYGISIGSHKLKLTKGRYDDWEGHINIEYHKIAWKHVYLRPSGM